MALSGHVHCIGGKREGDWPRNHQSGSQELLEMLLFNVCRSLQAAPRCWPVSPINLQHPCLKRPAHQPKQISLAVLKQLSDSHSKS